MLRTYTQFNGFEVRVAPAPGGVTDVDAARALFDGAFAFVAANPNFYGSIEDLRALFAAARGAGLMTIAAVNPATLGVLEAPGALGADIAVGEGQPLGCPQYYGGPGFGFLAARKEHVRQIPGRLVGQTVDADGRRAFCLTFQTREQHIRRAGATSNICTNNALMTLRAVVYMSLVGREGLREVGMLSAAGAHYAAARIAALPGYALAYAGKPFFNEFVVSCPRPAREVVAAAAERGILAGVPMDRFYGERTHDLLVAVTEKRTRDEIDALAAALGETGGAR